MARIVMADDGLPFDGAMAARQPMGGAESAFVQLAETFAWRGHEVLARTAITTECRHAGVTWSPVRGPWPDTCDLYVANRSGRLLGRVRRAGAEAFWVHNACGYLAKVRHAWPLARRRPHVVLLGAYHASTWPWWLPSGPRHRIPHGLAELFLTAPPRTAPPPPRAVFTSNPTRGLARLLDLWTADIRPRVPDAGLDIYWGAAVYGGRGDAAVEAVLRRAASLAEAGVRVHDPLDKAALAGVLRDARVMLYPADVAETFCFSVAEAQALGTPAVVLDRGALAERVRDGESGRVVASDAAFALAAAGILADDDEWRRLHDGALATRAEAGWSRAAAAFERLIPAAGGGGAARG